LPPTLLARADEVIGSSWYKAQCGAAAWLRSQTDHSRHWTHESVVKSISQHETFFGETSREETDAISICMFLTMVARVASDVQWRCKVRVLPAG